MKHSKNKEQVKILSTHIGIDFHSISHLLSNFHKDIDISKMNHTNLNNQSLKRLQVSEAMMQME
jgi:hypothetical protein